MIRHASPILVLLCLTGMVARGQNDNDERVPSMLRIMSPTDESHVVGPTVLRAAVDSVDAVSSVVFFADGRETCALTQPPFECAWDAGPVIAEHQIRVVATLVAGGRVVRTVHTKGVSSNFKVGVEAVQVTASARDEHGRFVRGLSKDAFHVFEDGVPQSIIDFGSSDLPLDLVVAADVSGSMVPALPKLKAAVKGFLTSVSPKDRVTLLGFNDSIFLLTRKSTVLAERVQAVDELQAWGATALYDVIIHSLDLLGRETGRKAIIVFTDGEDQGSHATLDMAERRLQEGDAPLYMIGQGRGVGFDNLKKVMQRLSGPTGGRAVSTDKIDDLRTVFAELLTELSNQYLLGYTPTNSKRDGSWRKIMVQVDGRYQVRAREGYRASRDPSP